MTNFPPLNYLPSKFMFEEKEEGLNGLFWPSYDTLTRFDGVLYRVWNDFAPEIESPLHKPILGIFFYQASECEKMFAESDGITVEWDSGYYIGLDAYTLSSSRDYLAFVLIHELCHALCDTGHSPHFEGKLNELLSRYNWLHGTNLQNDLSSYNDE